MRWVAEEEHEDNQQKAKKNIEFVLLDMSSNNNFHVKKVH